MQERTLRSHGTGGNPEMCDAPLFLGQPCSSVWVAVSVPDTHDRDLNSDVALLLEADRA
jgi:hypothetical protein